MRIGIDAGNLRQYGGRTHLRELLANACPEDFGVRDVTIWAGPDTITAVPDREWLRKVPVPFLKGSPVRLALWRRFVLPRQAAAECDLLFVPGGGGAGGFRPVVTMSRNMAPFAPDLIRRYGWSANGIRLRLLRIIYKHEYRRADGVVFLNEFAQKEIVSQIGDLQGDIANIPHGLNPGMFLAPRPQREIASFSAEHPFRWVYLSRITYYKHYDTVIKAMLGVRRAGFPVRLRIIGSGSKPEVDWLMGLMAALDPKGEVIEYVGGVAHENLRSEFQNADGALFASSCENMPNVLLEYMAGGLPIACSGMEPMLSVLGHAGVYFDPTNHQELAGILMHLMQAQELRSELAHAAYARAQKYSWKRCADETFQFLRFCYDAYSRKGTQKRGPWRVFS